MKTMEAISGALWEPERTGTRSRQLSEQGWTGLPVFPGNAPGQKLYAAMITSPENWVEYSKARSMAIYIVT